MQQAYRIRNYAGRLKACARHYVSALDVSGTTRTAAPAATRGCARRRGRCARRRAATSSDRRRSRRRPPTRRCSARRRSAASRRMRPREARSGSRSGGRRRLCHRRTILKRPCGVEALTMAVSGFAIHLCLAEEAGGSALVENQEISVGYGQISRVISGKHDI